jgi:hypothetical protein
MRCDSPFRSRPNKYLNSLSLWCASSIYHGCLDQHGRMGRLVVRLPPKSDVDNNWRSSTFTRKTSAISMLILYSMAGDCNVSCRRSWFWILDGWRGDSTTRHCPTIARPTDCKSWSESRATFLERGFGREGLCETGTEDWTGSEGVTDVQSDVSPMIEHRKSKGNCVYRNESQCIYKMLYLCMSPAEYATQSKAISIHHHM